MRRAMFNSSSRQQKPNGDENARQPLLDEEDRNGHVLFSVDDDEEGAAEHFDRNEDEESRPNKTRSVRFQEEVRIIAPPLRSTLASREAGRIAMKYHNIY